MGRSLVESENDLSKILDVGKMNEIQYSDQLKEFYKKLVQADAAIRNLRKTLNDNSAVNTDRYNLNNIDLDNQLDNELDVNNRIGLNNNYNLNNNYDFNNNPDRIKRSLNLFHRPTKTHSKKTEQATKSIIQKGKVISKTTVIMTNNKKVNQRSRDKRFGNFNDTEGFVIEKNQVVIQYKPSPNRIVAKCSHVPKDSHSHETQLKHPFYKNTQRLDELLDQFMDKKIPELFSDNFELNIFKDQKKKCKHPPKEEAVIGKTEQQNTSTEKPDQIVNNNAVKEDTTTESVGNSGKTENDSFESDFFDDSEGVDSKIERSTSSSYDILLSISTNFDPNNKRTTSNPASVLVERVPNLRKLMQIDAKEDEGLGYEDFKEVLADDKEDHDDNEKEIDRRKRNTEPQAHTLDTDLKPNPTSVHNPNWKGPMPLYPEELNQIVNVKQSSYPDSKVEIPVHNMDSAPESDEFEAALTDVQYVEDYLDNGYEKLSELAQAYSDYGVLSEKKDTESEKKSEESEKDEHKLDDRKVRSIKRGNKYTPHANRNFQRYKKETNAAAEGIRIEIHPTTAAARDDNPSEIYRLLHKHVKITNMPRGGKPSRYHSSTPPPTITLMNELSEETPKYNNEDKQKIDTDFDNTDGNEIVFTVNKKRTLKSDFDDSSYNFNDETTKIPVSLDNFEFVSGKFKRETENTLRNLSINANESEQSSNNGNIEDVTLIKNTAEAKPNSAKYSNITTSDFFMLLSKWFSSLDDDSLNINNGVASEIAQSRDIIKLEKRNSSNYSTDPLYDSDMIGNISHKSRVLLSIEENNITKEIDNLQSEEEADKNIESSTKVSIKIPNITINIEKPQEIMSTATGDNINENNTETRIIKRQATDDSNLIFWHDLYDDEYGVKVDPAENNIRDTQSDKNDFVKKSNSWIQDKVKTITNKLNAGYFRKDGKRLSRQAPEIGLKQHKRITRSLEDEEESGTNSKVDFVALTAKMKEVCKNTAKIVKETKNIQVREENKEDHVASSLMQQLVRLMTDLVDFQVQERTCRKLPPDLQKFLEWLTRPDDENEADSYSSDVKDSDLPASVTFEKTTEHEKDLLQPSEKENADSRTDCLGTLHVVQDLMQQYDQMSSKDQSLMPGVRTYLENQMDYLQRQVSVMDEQNFYDNESRFKRDMITHVGHTISNTIDATARTMEHEYKNFKHMYHKLIDKIKHASKQAAKTTQSIKETATSIAKKISKVTKSKNKHKTHKPTDKPKNNKDLEKLHSKDQKGVHQKDHMHFRDKIHLKDKIHKHKENHVDKGEVKDIKAVINGSEMEDIELETERYNNRDERNIKDVYYKAIEEAKKGTTMKNSHKRDNEMFGNAELLRLPD